MGDVSTEDLRNAVQEAMQRLKSGEYHLAVHPNCGTNIATAGILAALAGFLAMFRTGRRWRDKLERLPLAASLATLAMLVARPLGYLLQRHITTSADLNNLEVVNIESRKRGWMRAHHIITRG